MRLHANGHLWNRHTGSSPAFVHYNGDSKRTWLGKFSAAALARALYEAYVKRTGDTLLSQLEPYMRTHVTFLGPSFERDHSVSVSDVCVHGGVGELGTQSEIRRS